MDCSSILKSSKAVQQPWQDKGSGGCSKRLWLLCLLLLERFLPAHCVYPFEDLQGLSSCSIRWCEGGEVQVCEWEPPANFCLQACTVNARRQRLPLSSAGELPKWHPLGLARLYMGTAGSSLEARVGECEQPARLPCSLKGVPSTWHPLGGAGLGTTSTSSNVRTSPCDLLSPRELLRGNFEVQVFKRRQPRHGRQRLVSESSSTSPHSLQDMYTTY